jgi:hypothetical protein
VQLDCNHGILCYDKWTNQNKGISSFIQVIIVNVRIKKMIVLLFTGLLFAIAGCGGGGSSGDSSTAPTSLKLTLSVGQSEVIGAISGDILLPEGSSVRTDATSQVLSDVFVFTGHSAGVQSSQVLASYIPSTRIIRFIIINAQGFTGGDVATLTVDIASGNPSPAVFVITNQKVIDVTTAALNIPITIK